MPLLSALAILLACAAAEDSAATEGATAPAVRTLIAGYTCIDGAAEWADGEPTPTGVPVSLAWWIGFDYGDQGWSWSTQPMTGTDSTGFRITGGGVDYCVYSGETAGRIVYSYTEQ